MMRLAALNAEERSWLHSGQRAGEIQALAERLQQTLVASLGQAVKVVALPMAAAADFGENEAPVIRLEPELAAAWLTLRFGGRMDSGTWPVRDTVLLEPFHGLIRRALAQTVINRGELAAWPQTLRLQVAIGPCQGRVEIFWNSRRAQDWARREIRGKR